MRMWTYETEKQDAVQYQRGISKNGKFYNNNVVFYLKNGFHHREDGPAVIDASGSKYWFLNGQHHRLDGPAAIWLDGSKYWYLNDKQYYIDKNISEDIQWIFIKGNIDNIEAIKNPTIEIQQYVLERNPYLIDKIHNIEPEIKKQYSDILITKGLGII